ncbi:MAG TPA: hypothetical protein VLJ11_12155 [Bryobacteraceae bacterium]|nr:hypothetical protein [Bryobacteraceae bacterium]
MKQAGASSAGLLLPATKRYLEPPLTSEWWLLAQYAAAQTNFSAG